MGDPGQGRAASEEWLETIEPHMGSLSGMVLGGLTYRSGLVQTPVARFVELSVLDVTTQCSVIFPAVMVLLSLREQQQLCRWNASFQGVVGFGRGR